MRKRLARATVSSLVLVSLLLVAGCSEPLTSASLEDAAAIEISAPELTAELSSSQSTFLADQFSVDVHWSEVDGAIGYQLQRDWDGDGNWSTVSASKDNLLFRLTRDFTNPFILGYEQTTKYRVRAVLAGHKQVSPWSAVRSVSTPKGNVLYEVEGTASSASITMRTSSGSQQATVSLPMKSTSGTTGIWLKASNMNPYISARALSSGTVTCRITVKGVVVSQNTSSGLGATATCSS